MNYEEKYNEALERARKELQEYVHKDCDDMTRRTAITIIHNLFPELKESEDERIRKELIEQVAYIVPKNYEVDSEGDALPTYQKRIDKYRAWLEKQKPIDEEELKKGALKYVARQFMNWLDAKIPNDKMCLSNMECKDIEDAFLKDDWARISHYMCEKLEKQGEQIELKKVEQGNHPRIVMADFNGGEGFFKLNLDNLNKEQVDAIEMMINNPKQGEQTQLDYEHADIPQKDFAPIEPKFMVGDWVMLTDPINNGERVQVKEIHGDGCITVDGAITKMFEPIPITADILEKYGFHESILRDDRWIYQDIAFTKVNDSYILSSLYDDFMIGIRPHICAAHELQHALRLCGIEKDFEL